MSQGFRLVAEDHKEISPSGFKFNFRRTYVELIVVVQKHETVLQSTDSHDDIFGAFSCKSGDKQQTVEGLHVDDMHPVPTPVQSY